MPIVNIVASKSYKLWGQTYTNNYTLAHNNVTQFDNYQTFYVGQKYWNEGEQDVMEIARSVIKFDTSIIPVNAIIQQVQLQMAPETDYQNVGIDFEFQLVKYDWSTYDPVTTGNKQSVYMGCLNALDYMVWAMHYDLFHHTPHIGNNIDTSWINKGGITYFGMRSDKDYESIPPEYMQQDWIEICNEDHIWTGIPGDPAPDPPDAWHPQLIIDYKKFYPMPGKK